MNKKREDEHPTQIKKILSNDITVTNIGIPFANNKINEIDKNEVNKKEINNPKVNNHEEIIIRTNKYNLSNSIIEAKLPNPYLDTECIKNKKYIDYNLNSKFKSKYADYINSNSSINNEIKVNKTHKITKKFDKYIYFTSLSPNKKNKKNYLSIINE